MSLNVCIPDLIEQGKMKGARAEEAQQRYDELVLQYRGRFGEAEAQSMATREVLDILDRDLLNRKRQTLLQAQAQARINDQARRTYNGGSADGAPVNGAAMMAHLVRDENARGIANVEYRWRNIKQQALGRLYDLLSAHRPNLLGQVRNPADMADVVRELFGATTGNPNARELAEAWRGTGEWLRQRFNAAGGDIGKLDTWAMPQSHDPQLVGSLTRNQWIERVTPRLDRAKMLDNLTGAPLSDMRLQHVLGEIYDSITSDGWNTRAPGSPGGRSTANRHAEHRVLHFKDADEWMAYQDEFGSGSAFDAMMGHVESMSRDIGAMEILGPNPAATVRWMQDMVTKDAANLGTTADRALAKVSAFRIGRVWDEMQGVNNRVVNRKLALFGSTIRNWQTSTRLGSATIASMSDHATAFLVRRYNGLPAFQLTGQYVKQLNPLSSGDRAFARRAGIISDELIGRMGNQGRLHFDESFGGGRLSEANAGIDGWFENRLERANEYTRRLADGVLRVSGLNAHTLAAREAMGMEFMNAIGTYRELSWDSVNPQFRGFLERYGMGAREWDQMRASPMSEYKGVDWVTPDDIARGAGGEALRDRFMEAMLSEIELAVPTGGMAIRSMVHFAPPGTLIGEVVRTGFQFKMFPVAVMALHGRRMMAQADIGRMAGYAVAFLGTTTLAGGLAFQLGEIVKGRDPMPMASGQFLWRAMLKGGGLGIYGDAINNSTNEYGQSPGDIVKGPLWSSVSALTQGAGAAWQTANAEGAEEEAKAARARSRAVRSLSREVPGSSLWYVRAAYERMFMDTVAGWADPDYATSAQRMEDRASKTGQQFFMMPNAPADSWRMPDVGNAFGAIEEQP